MPELDLIIEGELSVGLPTGKSSKLESTGSSLRWIVDDLRDIAPLDIHDRALRRRYARTLDRFGLTLLVQEGDEVMMSVGAGERSFLGWVLVGSSRFQLHHPLAWFRAFVR